VRGALPSPMVSDQDLAHYVESLVRQTASRGGSAISADAVVRQLEAQLRVDLTPKAQLIRDILVALLGPAHGPEHPSRKDPFEVAAGGSAGAAAPAQSPFATSSAASASASAPQPAPVVPHFFPQQMQSFLPAPAQYQQHRPGAPASPFDVPASYHYTPQINDARRAGLAYLQQLQEARQYSQQHEHQQHTATAAPAPAAAAATTPGESPRAPAASAGSKKDR
jgi:upstream activation factor subunit UAF30